MLTEAQALVAAYWKVLEHHCGLIVSKALLPKLKKNVVVYPDGHSMINDMQKQYLFQIESKLKNSELNSMDIQKYEMPDLTKSFPPELIASDNGVCVYFNPDEGREIMQEFYDILNGFKKGKKASTD